MQKQDFFSKQDTRGVFTGGTIRQQPKKEGNSVRTRIIIILLLIVIGLGFIYKNQLFNQEFDESSLEDTLLIGSSIQEEGSLVADGDIINYTHTLTNSLGEIFLLKSRTLSLNNISNLSGTFQIIGTIESTYSGYPLVEVSSIVKIGDDGEELQEEEIQIVEEGTPGIYVKEVALGFPAEFYDNYAFIGEPGSNNEIRIRNLDNDKVTTISSFTCSDSGDTNCKQLTKTFNSNAEKKLTSINGDVFYKLPDVKSWYFQNQDWYGFFINDADDTEVDLLKNYIIIPNTDVIKDIVARYGLRTCLGNDSSLSTITSHTFAMTSKGVQITMKGVGEKNFQCEATLDFSLPNKLKFEDLKIVEEGELTEDSEEKSEETEKNKEVALVGDLPITPSTTQFPINVEKALSYKSSRGGYTMTFPSPNISYSSDSADEDFDQAGVHCNYTVKVIQYKDKENLMNNPTVTVYECKIKNELKLPGENYFTQKLGDKTFVISVNNPARFDFAKNISIEEL